MLKRLIWIVLIIAVLFVASYIWRDHFPWLQQWHQQLGLPEPPASLDPLRTPAGKAVVYRWQDDEGNWHFDNHPPRGREYDRLVVDTDANLMPGQQ